MPSNFIEIRHRQKTLEPAQRRIALLPVTSTLGALRSSAYWRCISARSGVASDLPTPKICQVPISWLPNGSPCVRSRVLTRAHLK